MDEGIPPGSLEEETEELKEEMKANEDSLVQAEKDAKAAGSCAALVKVLMGLVSNGETGEDVGRVLGTDEGTDAEGEETPSWFIVLLETAQLPPTDSYSVKDVRNVAWSLMKHKNVPTNPQLCCGQSL